MKNSDEINRYSFVGIFDYVPYNIIDQTVWK